MTANRRRHCLAALLLVLAAGAAHAQDGDFTPVTDAMLQSCGGGA